MIKGFDISFLQYINGILNVNVLLKNTSLPDKGSFRYLTQVIREEDDSGHLGLSLLGTKQPRLCYPSKQIAPKNVVYVVYCICSI